MFGEEALLRDNRAAELAQWRDREKTALDLLQIVGELRFDRAIDLTLFRTLIYDCRPSQVLQALESWPHYSKRPIDVDLILSLAYSVAQLEELERCKIDLGRLATEWQEHSREFANMDAFVGEKLRGLATVLTEGDQEEPGRDVVLYGFGRIGRSVARQLARHTGRGSQLRLRAIVLRGKLDDPHVELSKRAALLQTDSIHGNFEGIVEVSPDARYLNINGISVDVIWATKPEQIDYTEYGIENALLIDNSGAFRCRAELERHLRPGIRSVLLTAPGEEVPNLSLIHI